MERIVTWQANLAAKYRPQILEDWAWDEQSAFATFEQPLPESLLNLFFVAAVFDQRGPEAARELRDRASPTVPAMLPAFRKAQRRGFVGSFPQLSLGAHYWLPFRPNMMIEEPNWRGTVERYGSVFHLHDEITRLQSLIGDADPSAAAWPQAERPPGSRMLVGAWQASVSILRLAVVAIAQRLPVWTDE